MLIVKPLKVNDLILLFCLECSIFIFMYLVFARYCKNDNKAMQDL